MKNRHLLIALSLILVQPALSFADIAVVVHKVSGCDYFMAEGKKGYYILEWYGGHDPDTDDIIAGPLSSYGFKDVQYTNIDTDGRVYIEDYGLSKDSALENLLEKCE